MKFSCLLMKCELFMQSFKPAVALMLLAMFVGMLAIETPVQAQLTPEHRRDLSNLRRELTKASSLIRRKDFEEAQKLLEETEGTLKEIASAAGVTDQDPAIAGLQKAIDTQKQQLQRQMNPGDASKPNQGISFSKEIAPILASKCVSCHDDDARGGLRLDTFAGLRQGGTSGPLLVPGSAQRSLLALRLVAPGQQRMPRGPQPLPPAEINKIAEWINQGARYDHDDETTLLADLGKPTMKKPEIKIAKPEGTETVSFKQDIAPLFVTFCIGCHGGNNPDSGFSWKPSRAC
ncbi:MAG: c-type cytochrome domain-containing protein [Planctomycetaceae bacterium]